MIKNALGESTCFLGLTRAWIPTALRKHRLGHFHWKFQLYLIFVISRCDRISSYQLLLSVGQSVSQSLIVFDFPSISAIVGNLLLYLSTLSYIATRYTSYLPPLSYQPELCEIVSPRAEFSSKI